MVGDTIYVTSTEGDSRYVYAYDRSKVENHSGEEPVPAKDKIRAPASSYMTVGPEGELYVGDTRNGVLYQVERNWLGEFEAVESWNTPADTNGVAVQPNGVFTFSTQNGRDERGHLVTVDSGDDGGISDSDLADADTIDVGNLVQNLAIVDGRIVSITEAGADQYGPDDRDSTPWQLWGQTHLAELVNGGGGYQVEPRTLRQAASDLAAAEAGLDDEHGRISSLSLPSSAVGTVSGAGAFATAVTHHFDGASFRLRNGVDALGVSVTGLLAAERLYQDADQNSAEDLSHYLDQMF